MACPSGCLNGGGQVFAGHWGMNKQYWLVCLSERRCCCLSHGCVLGWWIDATKGRAVRSGVDPEAGRDVSSSGAPAAYILSCGYVLACRWFSHADIFPVQDVRPRWPADNPLVRYVYTSPNLGSCYGPQARNLLHTQYHQRCSATSPISEPLLVLPARACLVFLHPLAWMCMHAQAPT